MKTIVFINTHKSGSSREAIRAAERLGYFTVLFTDRPNFLEKRTEFPDVHLMKLLDLNDIEKLKKSIYSLTLRALKICAIVSMVDPYCHTACLLGEEFGVNHFSTEGIANMQNKLLSRQILSQSPYGPYFISIPKDSSLSTSKIKQYLPLIVKSPNSSGSKDVFMVNTSKELKHRIKGLNRKYSDTPVLVEEFLHGPQFLVEAIVYQNKLHIIAIIHQEIIYCNKHFIVTGYNLLLDLPADFYESLKQAVESIIKIHGMKSGPCHLEMRYVKKQWKLIEANPRISGAGMNKLIETGLGINLVEETLKLALGQEPDLQPKHKKHVFAQYRILSETGILKKVTGKGKAIKSQGVEAVYVKPRKGTLLTPPLSMGNRYAYVIASGDSENDAKENAKNAASLIKFWLLPPEKKLQDISEEKYKYEHSEENHNS